MALRTMKTKSKSFISEQEFNTRLTREKAKTGAITASLAWNDPSDLDLHATVDLKKGKRQAHIFYSKKEDAGGKLDVDMHASEIVESPVENIFWKEPPAGLYSVFVNLFTKRGEKADVPFTMRLQREEEETLTVEGTLGSKGNRVECFRFSVDDDGTVTMEEVGGPLPIDKAKPKAKAKVKAAAAKAKGKAKGKAKAKAKAKVKAKVKAKAKAKVKAKAKAKSKIATGKKAKVEVYQGKKLKTSAGLKKEDLIKSKSGKIVSAKKSAQGKNSKLFVAMAKARAAKGYSGYKPFKKGTSFYEKTKEIMQGS